jgi:hypothetical protein
MSLETRQFLNDLHNRDLRVVIHANHRIGIVSAGKAQATVDDRTFIAQHAIELRRIVRAREDRELRSYLLSEQRRVIPFLSTADLLLFASPRVRAIVTGGAA